MPVRRQYQPIGNIITDVSGARALNVIYQNNTGQMLLVMVNTTNSVRDAFDSSRLDLQVENATPPTVAVATNGLQTMGNLAGALRLNLISVFTVPIGNYYRALATVAGGVAATLTLDTWYEVQLIAPQSAGF